MEWWKKEIENIQNDNKNGATFLTLAAIKIVKEMSIKKCKKEDIKIALKFLMSVQPMMASIYNFVYRLSKFAELDYEEIIKYCKAFEKEFKEANERVAKNSLKCFKNNRAVLTHSFSSLVYNSFLEAKKAGFEFEVICSESRPKNEGVELAEKLCKEGIKTTLVTDAAAPFFAKDVDIVLFGADGVGDFGLVHKVGSYAIALAAKKSNVKVVSLAPTFKFWPKDFKQPQIELKKPNELAKGCFEVKNIYFDITPLELVDSFVTEINI